MQAGLSGKRIHEGKLLDRLQRTRYWLGIWLLRAICGWRAPASDSNGVGIVCDRDAGWGTVRQTQMSLEAAFGRADRRGACSRDAAEGDLARRRGGEDGGGDSGGSAEGRGPRRRSLRRRRGGKQIRRRHFIRPRRPRARRRHQGRRRQQRKSSRRYFQSMRWPPGGEPRWFCRR